MTSNVSTIDRPSRLSDLPAIAVSGSLGSGARDIALVVARALRISYAEEEILREAAHELGVSIETLVLRGHCPSGIRGRIESVLRVVVAAMAAADTVFVPATGVPEYPLGRPDIDITPEPLSIERLDDRRFAAALTSVIGRIAAEGNVVILGHGSEVVVKAGERALRVYVYAPLEYRVSTVMRRTGVSRREAAQLASQDDRDQRAFVRHFFGQKLDDPCAYDLVVRMDRLSFDVAVQLISLAARARATRCG
jgi:cytidylate kinase